MTDDLVKRLNEDFSVNAREDIHHQMKVYEAERKEAADRIEQIKELYLEYVDVAEERAARIKQLETALRKIVAIEDEHINVPKTEEGAHLWTALAMCVELAERALGEKNDGTA